MSTVVVCICSIQPHLIFQHYATCCLWTWTRTRLTTSLAGLIVFPRVDHKSPQRSIPRSRGRVIWSPNIDPHSHACTAVAHPNPNGVLSSSEVFILYVSLPFTPGCNLRLIMSVPVEVCVRS
jgi:hypothetical protein